MSEKLNHNTELSLGQQSIDEFKASIDDRKRPGRFIENNYERYKKLHRLAGEAAIKAAQAEESLASLPTIPSLEHELDTIRQFESYEDYKATADHVDDMAAAAIAEISDREVTAHALENHVSETKIHLDFDDKTAAKIHKQALKENKKFDKDRELPPVAVELEATKEQLRRLKEELINKTLQMKPLSLALEKTQGEYDRAMELWTEIKPKAEAYNTALDEILTRSGDSNTSDDGYHVGYRHTTVYADGHIKLARWHTFGGSASYEPDFGRRIDLGKAGESLESLSPTSAGSVGRGPVEKKRPLDFFEIEMSNPEVEARGQIELALGAEAEADSALQYKHDTSGQASRLGAYFDSKKVVKQLELEIQRLKTVNLEKIAFDSTVHLMDKFEKELAISEVLFKNFPKIDNELMKNKLIRQEFERYFRE